MNWNYVVIEGNIGAGKTSLATMLSQELNTRLVLETFADNPFLPQFYENPERHAFSLELSFVAERYQQMKEVLAEPDLFQPKIISDYYILKSLIYARVNLPDLELSLFNKLYRIVFDALPAPDLIVYLNSDIPRLQENIRKRGRDYEKDISNTYLESIQEGYVEAIKSIQNIPIVLVETSGIDFVKEASVFQKIKGILNEEFKPGLNYFQL